MAETREPEEMTRQCRDCGHANPFSHRFCEECGGALRASDRAKAGAGVEESEVPPRRRAAAKARARVKTATAASLDKHAARIEFSKVKTVAFRLRAIYALGIAVVLVGLLDLIALSNWGFEIAWGLVLLVVGITVAVKTAGTILVMRQPLVWGVVIAAEHTLTTALNWIFYLSVTLTIPTGASSVIAILMLFMKILPILNLIFVPIYWAAVIQAARLQKLMIENPELQLKRRRLDPERHVEGGVADSMRQRRVTSRRQGARAALRIVAVAVPAVVLLILVVWLAGRPEPVSSRVERFTASWKDGDLDGIVGLFPEDGDRNAFSLREGIVRRGWDKTPPDLTTPEMNERHETYVEAAFSISHGQVVAHWRFRESDNAWHLVGVDLPDIQTEPIETFIRRFRSAWETSGTDALMATLEDSFRARRGSRLVRLFERRGWSETRPAIEDTAVRPRSNGRAQVDLATEAGDVDLSCEYWHPHWRLVGIGLPDDR